MQMVKSRNITSHTYNEGTANEIISLIKNLYFEAFEELRVKMNELQREESNQL